MHLHTDEHLLFSELTWNILLFSELAWNISEFSNDFLFFHAHFISEIQWNSHTVSLCHLTHRFWRFPKPMLPFSPSKTMLPVLMKKRCISLLRNCRRRLYKT